MPRRLLLPIVAIAFAFVIYIPSSHAFARDPASPTNEAIPDDRLMKLRTSAANGTMEAELELAAHYLSGDGVPQDTALAAHWYEKAAQQGNPDAANEIGYFYQKGIGVPIDLSRAIHWYQLASAEGSVSGKLNLGILYVTGTGVKKNAPVAAEMFEDAVKKGSGAAAAYLGTIYTFGMLGTPDPIQAEKWYQVGVKLHDCIAEYNEATLLSVTPGHFQDLPQAAALLRLSVKDGYVPSMHALGILLIRHPEVKHPGEESRPLIEAAAASGFWRSSVLLGILARDGIGRPADKKDALLHFRIALLQGGEQAASALKSDLKNLSSGLTPEESASIDASASDWYTQHNLQSDFLTTASHSKYFPYPHFVVAPGSADATAPPL